MNPSLPSRNPFADVDRVPHGAGLAMHLIGLCWALRLYCVASALLRAPHMAVSRSTDNRVQFDIVSATGFDRRVLDANSAEVCQAMRPITVDPPRLNTHLPRDVEGPLGDELRSVSGLAPELLPVETTGAVPTPTFDGRSAALRYATTRLPKGVFGADAPLAHASVLLTEDYRNLGQCLCTVCTGPEDVFLVSSSLAAKDGFGMSAIAGDLLGMLALPNAWHLETSTGNLAALAHWIDKALPRRLSSTPGTLAIARGGGFDNEALMTFVEIAGPRLAALGAEGWNIHVALGHSRATVSIPHVVSHRSTSVMDERVARRLSNTTRASVQDVA